jgi:hypothetical protein
MSSFQTSASINHINQKKKPLKKTLNFEDYTIVECSVNLVDFCKKFGTPSSFYRKLAKSNSSIGRRKNRDFFSIYFSGGAYTFFRTPTLIHLIFLLKNKKDITPSVITSLKVRLKKMYIKQDISIYSSLNPENISEDAKELIEKINDYQNILQPIGEDYSKKRCSENFLLTSEN